MNNNRLLSLAGLAVVSFAAVGCDFKETRSGRITLATAAGIPLNGRAGSAELAAGSAELTFKKGSADSRIAIKVRQPARADVEFEAAVSGNYKTGNFTLRGADIGQPVDMVSVRAFTNTGPREYWSEWIDEGNRICRVEYSYDPCDENWSVTFRSFSGQELGAFAARTGTRCNESRSMPHSCHYDRRIPDYPRYPGGYPRGPHGRGGFYQGVSEIGPENLKFD